MTASSAFMRTLGRRLQLSFTVYQDAALDALDALLPKSVVDTYSDTKRKRRACMGDIRVDKIRHMLESGFGVTRSKMQVSFHESFLAATSRHLYSEDENVDWARVKTQQGWEDTRSVVLAQTPRRFGKTWSVGLFIAAYVVTVPNSEQSIFSSKNFHIRC